MRYVVFRCAHADGERCSKGGRTEGEGWLKGSPWPPDLFCPPNHLFPASLSFPLPPSDPPSLCPSHPAPYALLGISRKTEHCLKRHGTK